MKRSKVIPLVLIGTMSIFGAGCSRTETVTTKQNEYRTAEDCRKDWGNDNRDCTMRSNGMGYVGPHYMYNHGGGYPMAVNSDGTTRALPNSYLSRPGSTSAASSVSSGSRSIGSSASSSVSRGGFGSSASSMSAGG